ncbi:MAG: sodium-dependent transporter [Oligoflexales bacterium]
MVAKNQRDHWGSKLGFILATSGAAVGLGNIQRFPYITAQWGGAAFVFIYLLCVLILGLPLILIEFSLGRHARKNPMAAVASINPNGIWKYFGLLGIATAFFILSYYVVVAGWTLGYSFQILSGQTIPIDEFSSEPWYCIPATALFQLISILIVGQGLKHGIEKLSKILMPLLVFLLVGLAIRSLSLDGASAGIKYYLSPDFSKIGPEAILFALCQAFFSLCIGEAVLVTYGSYTRKHDNLVASAAYIALFDTLIALLSGLIIFPALFAFGEPVEQGIGLIFNVMPQIFLKIPYGSVFGFGFFAILAFAALTTCVALIEIPSSFLMETFGLKRKKAVWLVGIASFLISIPSALSHGANHFLSQISIPSLKISGFYEIMDFFWGSLAMVLGGLGLTVFVAWVWGSNEAAKELTLGSPRFPKIARVWSFHIKFICPLLIILILCGLFLI